MNPILDGLGRRGLDYPDFVSGGVALSILAICVAIAWLVGRRAGPALANLWHRYAGARSEGLGARMCDLTRYLTLAILLAIAANVDSWPPLSALILGLPLAATVGLLVRESVRGLHMARWLALLLAAVAFVAMLADALGGLDAVTGALNQVGFTAGKRRFSLLGVLQILVALAILFAVVRLINRVATHSIRRSHALDATQQLLAQKLLGVALLIAAFFIGIDLVGIDLTALAVFSGAFGLAIGFGLQKTFGNLIAGIILLMDRSIKPGDVIAVGDSFGTVNKIGVRAISIITREAKEHLIPNENLMTQEVVNWSFSSRDVRITIPVGVAYGADIKLAQKLMFEAAKASARVLDQPPPKVWMAAFGESSVDHEIRLWIRDPEDGIAPVRSDVLNRVWDLFKEHGIELPFPQRDIWVKEWPGVPALEPENPGESGERNR